MIGSGGEGIEGAASAGGRAEVEALVRAKRGSSISVVLPARDVALTIGPIVETIDQLRRAGLVDEIVVVDANSADGTAAIAARAGADVIQRDEVMTEHGPALGKGDALWRGLAVAQSDVVVFVDSDTRNFGPGFITSLVGPLLEIPAISFVKAAFERPLHFADGRTENDGGRVTELVARPLVEMFFPELGGFRQPLAGEVAARRDLLRSLPFPVGFGVEIAMLIDVWRAVSLNGMTQVDLGRREDTNKSLTELAPMARSVLGAGLQRAGVQIAERPGGTGPPGPLLERPPLDSLA